LLAAREDLRNATQEECATAETIAKDAVLTGEQKQHEDVPSQRTKGKGRAKGSEARGPTIPRATPEPSERVFERKNRDVQHVVLSRIGGPTNRDITRRDVFNQRATQRIETYRCNVGDVTGDRAAELAEALPDGVKDIFPRIYLRFPRAELEGVARVEGLGRRAAAGAMDRPKAVGDRSPADGDDIVDRVPLCGGKVEDVSLDLPASQAAEDGPLEPVAVEDAAEQIAREQLEHEQEQVKMDRAEWKRLALDDAPASMKKQKVARDANGSCALAYDHYAFSPAG